jgi:hypothetical protein
VVTSLNVKYFPLAAEIQVVIHRSLLLGVLRPLEVYKMSVSGKYCSRNVEFIVLIGYVECEKKSTRLFPFLRTLFRVTSYTSAAGPVLKYVVMKALR